MKKDKFGEKGGRRRMAKRRVQEGGRSRETRKEERRKSRKKGKGKKKRKIGQAKEEIEGIPPRNASFPLVIDRRGSQGVKMLRKNA